MMRPMQTRPARDALYGLGLGAALALLGHLGALAANAAPPADEASRRVSAPR
jgi:hypothetical protein